MPTIMSIFMNASDDLLLPTASRNFILLAAIDITST